MTGPRLFAALRWLTLSLAFLAVPAAADVREPRFTPTANRIERDAPPPIIGESSLGSWHRFFDATGAKALAVSRTTGGWSSMTAQTDTEQARTHVVRTALELCEYHANAPCSLYIVGDRIGRLDATGYPSAQPALLRWKGELKQDDIPFVTDGMRRGIGGNYMKAAGPKALAVRVNRAQWATGDTDEEAAAAALAKCNSGQNPQDCAIYAINDRIALTPWVGDGRSPPNDWPKYRGR